MKPGESFMALLEQSPPPIARIERALETMPPAELATVIDRGAPAAIMVDYYFRLLPENLALRFIESAEFDLPTRIHLFNCQLARYYIAAAEALRGGPPGQLIDSYWRFLSEPGFVELYCQLVNTERLDDEDAYEWLKVVDLARLSALLENEVFDGARALQFFRELDNAELQGLGARVDLFDFVYRLARSREDNAFLARLDVHADRIIHLRAARAIAAEVAGRLDSHGRVPLPVVARLIENAGDESFRTALEILEERHLVDHGTVQALSRLQESPPAMH
ncbi:MAG: hypothetical protein K1X75_16835 [Leptospirales bacterium]|nr:hypothetical protein [Leptospirales bacterium]